MQSDQRLAQIFNAWMTDSCTEAEREEVMDLLAKADPKRELTPLMLQSWLQLPDTREFTPQQQAVLMEKLIAKQGNKATASMHRIHFLKTTWFRYAAVIIFAIATGTYLWFQNRQVQTLANIDKQRVTDIAPGKKGAILTLADGTELVLDSLESGVIATQQGTVAVLTNGQLSYAHTGKNQGPIVYNTMSTPKGRQYQVTLPDGTVVWLNAASSIRYPTVFTGQERHVEIKGEAYFEVAKNARMPFRVSVMDRAEIEVLGTHFNVDAYDNNKTLNTTLLEGSVKVNGTIIKPGEQVQLTQTAFEVKNVDIEKVMAWKNGLFDFEGATLDEVMKQLERWYDIEVVYENGIPNIEFGGEMTKNISLKGLLLMLEKSDIHYRLEGRKLVVLP